MNKQLDQKFDELEGLTWYPWIGDEYFSANENNRILIVGESHFLDDTKESIEKHNRKDFTRIVVKEIGIERNYYKTKIFPNFHKAIFGNDNFNSSAFWNSVSFYNFIQRPLSSKNTRPMTTDFREGWQNFFDVINIIKPRTCIFIGNSSADHLGKEIKNSTYRTDGIKWVEKIGRTYGKVGKIKGENGIETQLIFIRHTNAYFKCEEWNNFLNNQIPNEIEWLKSRLNQ